MAEESKKTYCEYKGNVAVIHIGKTEKERLEELTSCAEEAAENKEVNVVVLDYESVDMMLSRDASQIIIVRDTFEPRDVYVCNVKETNLNVLKMLGVTKLDGIYVKGTLKEVLDELTGGKQE
jgi:hypothetical protein